MYVAVLVGGHIPRLWMVWWKKMGQLATQEVILWHIPLGIPTLRWLSPRYRVHPLSSITWLLLPASCNSHSQHM